MKMESLQQRKEELERKEYSLKEHLLKFDHFLKVSGLNMVFGKQKKWSIGFHQTFYAGGLNDFLIYVSSRVVEFYLLKL